jgi:Nucleotidyl transferase AbiEii toxin, Type IV TA system
MNTEVTAIWNKLSAIEKRDIFNAVAAEWNLPPAAIEKDWWVTQTLQLIFTTEIAAHTVFKGGTSLSKAWNLIDRFSEDIDLALDRTFLGFGEQINASQVKKLRQQSFKYISATFFPLLQKTFAAAGFADVELQLTEAIANDQDPLIIEVNYPGVTDTSAYLQPRVLVEIGSRSLKEPFTQKQFCSFVGQHFKGRPFADEPITIATVNPERTFLEKIFLLHEMFQQPDEKIKVNRLSRHLYDIEKMMGTAFEEKALTDTHLYNHIVAHRKIVTPVRGIDYANHRPDKINPLPPDNIIAAWKKDYEQMQQSMIYGQSIPFDILLQRIMLLKEKINALNI